MKPEHLREAGTGSARITGASLRDRVISVMLPNSNFWLNPLSECQKPLPASEIALLMNGKIFETLKKTR